MQFIEKNSFNVRSAVYRLRKRDCALEFILFPMVHIGSSQFYTDVRERLMNCDLILAEGVRSRKGNLLTLSYRIVKRIKRMEMVTQQEALKLSDLTDRIINTDMEGDKFDDRWRALPAMVKVPFFLLVPVWVIYLFLFGTKDLIARHMALDDLASRDEILDYNDDMGKLDSLLIDERDQLLLRKIEEVYKTNGEDKKTVGVLYGAQHMRNVERFLSEKLGFRIIDSEWLTVFDLL